MCLAIPMQVVRTDGMMARYSANGIERDVSLYLQQPESVHPGGLCHCPRWPERAGQSCAGTGLGDVARSGTGVWNRNREDDATLGIDAQVRAAIPALLREIAADLQTLI